LGKMTTFFIFGFNVGENKDAILLSYIKS